MSTSTGIEALNARSNINSPEIDGCAEFEEKLVDVREEIGKQKNSFTKVVKSCQEKSKKCAQELEECRQKLKDTEECGLKLEKRDEVIRDAIDRLNLIIEDLKNKNPDSGDNKGGTGGKTDKDTGTVVDVGEITWDHAKVENCGTYADRFRADIGRKSFCAYDLVKAFYPEMFDNPEIMKHIEEGAHSRYGAANYTFAFSFNIADTSAFHSNMWCYKCTGRSHLACKDQSGEFKSYCYATSDVYNQEYSKNFFNKKCPNLISESSSADVIKAKQFAPLILVNSAGQMIDKDGRNTEIQYSTLLPYLTDDRTMVDCRDYQKFCKKFKDMNIMEKVAWNNDKVVLLKTPSCTCNTEKTSTYFHELDNPDANTFIDDVLI